MSSLPLRLSLALCASALACSPGGESPPAATGHAFGLEACPLVLSGTVPASADTRLATGVATVRYEADRGTREIRLALEDEGGASLGDVLLAIDVKALPHLAWTVDAAYRVDDERQAWQRTEGRFAGGLARHHTVHALGEERAHTWWSVDGERALQRVTLGAPAAEQGEPSEGQLRTAAGLFDVVEAVLDGEVRAAAIASFIDGAGLAAFQEDERYLRLHLVSDDEVWREALTHQIFACAVGGTPPTEEPLLTTPGQSQQALDCPKAANPFAGVLDAAGALGTIQDSISVTDSLINNQHIKAGSVAKALGGGIIGGFVAGAVIFIIFDS